MAGAVSIGFHGKLPSLGDFVGRGVAPAAVETWDQWLQLAVSESRAALADRWLDLYLTAPMWRFCAQAGVIDEYPLAGVLFPSVDRVGRYFPFTVFARLPPHAAGLVVADRCAAWFDRIEDLVLAHLEGENHTVDDLAEAIDATAERLAAAIDTVPGHLAGASYREPGESLTGCLHLTLGERVDVAPTALRWLDQYIERALPGTMHWWTSGSGIIRPSWLITRGLPAPRAFASMLAGTWGDWPWESADALESVPVLAEDSGLQFESSVATHPGHAREENQDACVARPEIGLWAVADGMGGHSAGGLASRSTADALANITAQAAFPELIRVVRDTLTDVNRYLHGLSMRAVNATVVGTTVVVLIVREGSGICIWAGDSRLYRLRGARLEQLTVDHSESPGEEAPGASANVITRAIGGHDEIELDQISFDVQPGDRYLLCSDGLYRELPVDEMVDLLTRSDSMTAEALVQRVLEGAAADNVTAVVVDARPAAA